MNIEVGNAPGAGRVGFMPDLSVPDDFDELASDDIADLFGAR